jgi:vesicle-fusing ATPase
VHVEVGLPDVRGREQIFRVHTSGFDRHGALGDDVDFTELARRSQVGRCVKVCGWIVEERRVGAGDPRGC